MLTIDDLENDARGLYSIAHQMRELTNRFHGMVGRRLAANHIRANAISEDDRVAIEGEVIFEAINRAASEPHSAARDIFENAVEESVRLILIHIVETTQLGRSTVETLH